MLKRDKCLLCNGDLSVYIDLGLQTNSSRFPKQNNYEENKEDDKEENKEEDREDDKIELKLMVCMGECGLYQLSNIIAPENLYTENYGYRSGINNTMKNHLKGIVEEINISDESIVLDIGSNDGTLLSYYPKNVTKIGIDPTAIAFKKYYQEEIIVIPKLFNRDEIRKVIGDKYITVVTSIAMFYDVLDPIKFVQDIKSILDPKGIWVTEQSYFHSMVERNSFDTICHEHTAYYSIKQMLYIASKTDMKLVDINFNNINGGSFRVTFTHSSNNVEISDHVSQFIHSESYKNLHSNFGVKITTIRDNTVNFIKRKTKQGKCIYVYGASTKGNVLLQYYGLDQKYIKAAADRNPDKRGLKTATNIPIVSEEEMRNDHPDYLLVLPWHFRDEFIERELDYLNRGGKMIFPLPDFEILGRKKAIITGVDGQIGYYLSILLVTKNYIVHGITNKEPKNLVKDVTYHICDISDEKKMKDIVKSVSPDEFYNLAAITNATVKDDLLIEHINGISLRYICHLCVKYDIKLFQAGSIEMFRGSKYINEDMNNYHPRNSYGKAKTTADIIVKYYRDKQNLFGCNGILTNTESPKRKDGFLFSKLKKEVSECYRTGKIVELGNLNYIKSWIHASDVAEAAFMILQQSIPKDYIISTDEFKPVKTVVETFFYEIFEKRLKWDGPNGYIDVFGNDLLVVKSEISQPRHYEKNESLTFNSKNLLEIGWSPKYNLSGIIKDVVRDIVSDIQ